MKQLLLTTAIALLMTVGACKAQEVKKTNSPGWVSEKGYWIVEDNVKKPKEYIVRFYNHFDVQVYQETIHNVRLHLNRKKVKIQLTKAMEEAVIAWENKNPLKQEDAMVMNRLTK